MRGKKEEGRRRRKREVEEGRRVDGPAMRLMRLWLWLAPLGMLALALLFAALAVGDGRWGLLAAMVVLALVAAALLAAHWWLLRRLKRAER